MTLILSSNFAFSILSSTCFSSIVDATSPDKLNPSKGFSEERSTTEVLAKSIFRIEFSFTFTSSSELIIATNPIINKIITIIDEMIPIIVVKMFFKKLFIIYF